jgi:phosphotriesterase-related protein
VAGGLATMNTIMTVLGPIETKDLGFCQFHEHIAISMGMSYLISSQLYMDDMQKSLEEVLRYKNKGGNTLIDAQPGGCNRIVPLLQSVAQKSGVNIIASTGFHKLIFYPENHWIHQISEEKLIQYFIDELNDGMYLENDLNYSTVQSTARAGIIKTALDTENLTPRYHKLFSAAARACIETGRSIMIHIEKASDPILLLEFLIQQGVKPAQMIFCHLDRAIDDLSIHKRIASAGAFLEYDTIGRFKYHSDEQELTIISEMLKSGFEHQLLFSLDTTAARMKAYSPDAIGLDYILTTFLNKMKNAAISDTQIRRIFYDNCIKALINQ